jgi:hypothetical protein
LCATNNVHVIPRRKENELCEYDQLAGWIYFAAIFEHNILNSILEEGRQRQRPDVHRQNTEYIAGACFILDEVKETPNGKWAEQLCTLPSVMYPLAFGKCRQRSTKSLHLYYFRSFGDSSTPVAMI